MIAYKGFEPGLICRGYQFVMGLNVTEKANCVANGFHCAENPLDCLTYYGNMDESEYYLVDAGGDIDEDDHDSKIACTELTILKKLTREDFFLHALVYMVDHPALERTNKITRERATASRGYAVVCGIDPVAKGQVGDILAFAAEEPYSGRIIQIAVARVDDEKFRAGVWYGVDLKERKVRIF